MKKPFKQTVIFNAIVRDVKTVREEAEILITDETGTIPCRANRSGKWEIQLFNGKWYDRTVLFTFTTKRIALCCIINHFYIFKAI